VNAFRLLPWRAAAPLLVILVAVSAASTVTGLMVSEVPTALASIVGTGGNVISVYSNVSRLPETSTVALSALPKLESLLGVTIVSPEVLSPALANDEVVFVRGVNVTSFMALDHPVLVRGLWPNGSVNTVLVGSRLAGNLKVNPGDSISLASFEGGPSHQVVVSGIFQTNTARDDELITNLGLAQQIRGVDGGTVSLYRVEIDPSRFNSSALLVALGANQSSGAVPGGQATQILPTSVLLTAGKYLVGEPVQAVDMILARNLGLSESSLWSLVVVVVLCSALAVYYGALWTLDAYSPLFNLLGSIGMSRRRKTGYLVLIVGLGSLVACLIGFVAGFYGLVYVSGALSVKVLFHSFIPTFNLGAALAAILLPTAIALAALVYSSQKGGPQFGAETNQV
jgi:hypothetical protein